MSLVILLMAEFRFCLGHEAIKITALATNFLKPMSEKTITIPFSRFLYFYCGLGTDHHSREISLEEAVIIKTAIDPEEQTVHVQFQELDSGKDLKHPILWLTKWWRDTQIKREADAKENSLLQSIDAKRKQNLIAAMTFLKSRMKIRDEQLILNTAKQLVIDCRGIPELGCKFLELTDDERKAWERDRKRWGKPTEKENSNEFKYLSLGEKL